MAYDQMTDTEYEEYLSLYRNRPQSLQGLAERYIDLAGRGWTKTRAADDCFESGESDVVLHLVLKCVKASPSLQKRLQEKGVWTDSWNGFLEEREQNKAFQFLSFDWRGVTIEVVHRPQWTKHVPTLAHLSITAVSPYRHALPITETGYLSHFFHAEKPHSECETKAFLCEWLDHEAKSPIWRALQQSQQQLSLF